MPDEFTLQDLIRKAAAAAPAGAGAASPAGELDPVSLSLLIAQNNRLIEQAINSLMEQIDELTP